MIHKYRAWSTITRQMYDVVKIDYTHNMVELIDKSDGHVTWAYITSSEHIFMELVDFTDKKGEEIYKKDIVRFSVNDGWDYAADGVGVVDYEAGRFVIRYDNCICDLAVSEVEVIGNIYENPELLEDNHG